MLSFTEDTFEQAVIELFENMGYTHIYASDMNRTDYSRPLLDDVSSCRKACRTCCSGRSHI